MEWNWRHLISKSWHFPASEDIMTKFKSQGLHIIRIHFWNACGSGSPPSLIPTLWNIGILLHWKATLGKRFRPECKRSNWQHRYNFTIHTLWICTKALKILHCTAYYGSTSYFQQTLYHVHVCMCVCQAFNKKVRPYIFSCKKRSSI